MASALRYFTLRKVQHSKFCLNYCKENVTNLIQLFSWQYLAICTMHVYGINTCLWSHRRRERKAFSFPSHMDVYCFVLLPCCFLFFVFTVCTLSFFWALELCSRDKCWRVYSLSHGCQEGTEEGEVKVRWRQVVWSWKPGVLMEVSGCCKGSVIGKMAQVDLLMFGWEESSDAGMRRG